MRPIQPVLTPIHGITGEGPRWQATTAEPWFDLAPVEAIAGRWVRLRWSSGLHDHVARPVIRCISAHDQRDALLACASFGRNCWIGYVPKGTRSVWLSPTNRPGGFGFRIDSLEVMPIAVVLALAASQAPGTTLHGLGAWLIRRPGDFRALLIEALSRRPLSHYPAWCAARQRALEPDGIDSMPQCADIRLRLLVPGSAATARLVEALERQLHVNWSVIALMGPAGWTARPAPHPRLTTGDTPAPWPVLVEGLADHDLVAALPLGAQLSATALAAVAAAAVRQPDTAIFFGDEDRVGPGGAQHSPLFRPGFDRRLAACDSFFGPATFVRAGVLRRGSLPEPAFAGTPEAFAAALAHKIRESDGEFTGESLSRVLVSLPEGPQPAPLSPPPAPPRVPAAPAQGDGPTIIIPTRDRLDLLRACVASILAKTTGPFRIIIVDNGSAEPATLSYLDALARNPRVLVARRPGAFNFSLLCNEGAALARSSVLVFLNNDTTILHADWLDTLGELARDPAVGAVGAKLLYPSGSVQHGGVIAGLGGRAGHFDHGIAPEDAGYFRRAGVIHHLSAVTGACLAVERAKFLAIGGFDAEHLPIDLNDIDLCFRLAERGWRTVIVPEAIVCHHESATRGHGGYRDRKYASERAYYCARWLAVLRADQAFNPNLSLYSASPALG